ncbi:MAG TPA: TolC family protein [Bacillota bacterium]|nr:TolC family protein [Bacillota bacterium]HPT87842.1 TolC family protein [Bacillota bacterium]
MKRLMMWMVLCCSILMLGSRGALAADQLLLESPLTIERAVELALNHSLRYQVAVKDVEIARFKAEQAHTGYLPKITFGAGVTVFNEVPDLVEIGRKLAALNNGLAAWAQLMGQYSQDSQLYQLLAQQLKMAEPPDDGLTYYGVKLRLEQPLYTGGKLTALNRQALANIDYAKANLAAAEANLIYEVKKAYYQAGMVAELDVMRAEVKLADLRQKKLAADNGVQMARSYLNFIMGIPLDSQYVLAPAEPVTAPKYDLAESKQLALKSRSEVLAAQAKVRLAKEGLAIAESARKPLVALFAEGQHQSTEFLEGKPDLSFGIVASFQLYDGGMAKHQAAEAQKVIEQAELAEKLTVQAVELEVEQAYTNLMNCREAVVVAEKGLVQAEETLRMASLAYQAGLGSSLERIDADTGLTQARNNYHQAVGNYQIALAQYQKALGISKEGLK